MTVRTYVGFVAAFPDEYDGGAPAGIELAEFISTQLNNRGFDTDSPTERGGYAWEFGSDVSEYKIWTIVGLVGDLDSNPPRQWLIMNDSKPGLFKRLFRGKQAVDEHQKSLRHFCENST